MQILFIISNYFFQTTVLSMRKTSLRKSLTQHPPAPPPPRHWWGCSGPPTLPPQSQGHGTHQTHPSLGLASSQPATHQWQNQLNNSAAYNITVKICFVQPSQAPAISMFSYSLVQRSKPIQYTIIPPQPGKWTASKTSDYEAEDGNCYLLSVITQVRYSTI